VKVSTEKKRLVGKLLALDDKNLTLQVEDEMARRILSRERITGLDISAGRRSLGRRALYGAGIGAVAGAVAVYAGPEEEHHLLTEAEGVGMLAVLFGGTGALVGMVAIPGERWEDVPLDSVQISFRPVPGRGAGVFVTVSF
jgi:hypothetical protein